METKNKSYYFKLLNSKLNGQYCINFNDTGYTEREWLDRFGDMSLDEAISAYAQKYDLTPLNNCAITPKNNC